MLTTEEEINNIPSFSSHYKPHLYLSKYKFSKEILLDIFCSEYMVYCYEDYYYDDITLDMIEEYQPHIDIHEFALLWNDLDEIREIELYCYFVIEILEKNKTKRDISEWKYNLIYNDYIKNNNNLIETFIEIMEINKYIKIKKLYDIEYDKINNNDKLLIKVKDILKNIPKRYSEIIPL